MPRTFFPRYSFIRSGDVSSGDCYPDHVPCLPLSIAYNLSFQVTFEEIYDNFSAAHSWEIYATALNVADETPCEFAIYNADSESQYDYTAVATQLPKFITGRPLSFTSDPAGNNTLFASFDVATGNDWTAYNAATMALLNQYNFLQYTYPINIGDCFRLHFYLDEYDEAGNRFRRIALGCTNCFTRISPDHCFTSALTYYCIEDTFGFVYNNLKNKVELPMYLRDPIMNDDSKIYTRSDGRITKLYERKEEQYTLETDLMPYSWLKALDIALSHDIVQIKNGNINSFDNYSPASQFVKKDNFEIEYQKGGLSAFGKGSCKLLNEDPIHLINNNCG